LSKTTVALARLGGFLAALLYTPVGRYWFPTTARLAGSDRAPRRLRLVEREKPVIRAVYALYPLMTMELP
jgi:hypothetical protein